MKIRFISDIHAGLNMTYSPTEFVDIMHSKKPADVTLIAGDMDADIEEAKVFLDQYFKDEKVVFVGGNHIVYNTRNKPLSTLLDEYQNTFNGQWKFLENNYVWLNEDIAVIGCIGWTDFLFGHQTKSQYVKRIEKEKAYRESHKETDSLMGDGKKVPIYYMGILPDNPAQEYDELDMGNKDSYRGRRMKDAVRNMNDYNCGKVIRDGKLDYLRPIDTYEIHKQSMKEIKRCYNEIVAKNPNATIILITHHPFTKKCESVKYKDDPLNAAFISNHDNWLKQFKQIKYIHCGHVHQRFFKKLQDKQIICNPMGYLAYYENIQDIPFDINYITEVE